MKIIKNLPWELDTIELPDCSFDLIYTDPPYEMEYASNIPGDRHWNSSGEAQKFKKLIGDEQGSVNWDFLSSELFRLLKNDRYLVLHCNIPFLTKHMSKFMAAGFTYKGLIIWQKKFAIGGDLKGAMKRDWEPIVYFAKGRPILNSVEVERAGEMVERKRISEVSDWIFPLSHKEKVGHPTQKPIELCKQVLKLTTKPADKVFDCFAGSGTVGVACRDLDRGYYLLEIDTEYFKLLKGRLENEKLA